MPYLRTNVNKNKNVYYQIITSILFFSLALIYCQGIVSLAQRSIWFELSISVLILIVSIPLFKKTENFSEIMRLIVLETYFNILCLITKLSPIEIPIWSKTIDYCFCFFFFLQITGFITSQIKKKAWFSIPISLALSIAIILWRLNGSGVRITNNNEIQFWGGNAPEFLQIIYLLWLLNILFVEHRSLLPKLTVAIVHIASFIIAYNSNEFFHARILTASHLFIINCVIIYKKQDWGGIYFSSISHFENFKKKRIYYLTLTVSLNVLAILTLISYMV
ncbi:hypothetical protein [Tenacibaculum sp. C7A-26P2]|uniref:hypothetical protein n=1 Tax=Tenacibaculum sp. C7A-26P2 TaxID=3447504 RepID=UPI003F83539A